MAKFLVFTISNCPYPLNTQCHTFVNKVHSCASVLKAEATICRIQPFFAKDQGAGPTDQGVQDTVLPNVG